MKLKTIIVDDEAPARILVSTFLKDDPEIELIGEYPNGFEGLKAINELHPDLVILDVQMPKITGFEMLELLDHHPIIIFSTAYDEFAIKAFEMNAVDYLLKPYAKSRFQEAIKKAKEKKLHATPATLTTETARLVAQHDTQTQYIQRIVVKTGTKINIITVDQIRYLWAEDDYVTIVAKSGKYLKQKTMKYFEEHLDPAEFIRIHRSSIVKITEIDRLELLGKDSHVLWLKDQTKLKVSRSGYPRLKEVLKF